MLGLIGCDMADGGEDVGGMRGCPLDAVSVVDTSLSGFMINVEVLEVVVEVYGAGAEVSAEEGSVSGKDSGDVDVSLSAQRDGQTGLPLVEVSDNSLGEVLRDVCPKEPCDEVAEDNGLVGLVVVWWSRDAGKIPEVAFPFVEAVVFAARVE